MNTPSIHCLYDAIVPLTELREHPRNPNRHTQKQSDLLARIIEATGWRNCIIVSKRSGCIVAGHGRLYAARTLKLESAPVQYQEFDSEEEELRHLVADNRLAEFSQRDDAALASILSELRDDGALQFTGYDETQMAKLLSKLSADTPAGDHAPDSTPDPNEALALKWGTAQGQVWTLGTHRLVIGDAALAATWELLMPGEQGRLVFTDPPYGVAYEDSKGRSIENDTLQRDDLAGFLTRVFSLACRVTIPECPFYVWHASSTRDDFSYAMKSVGLEERQYITWIKDGFVLGHQDFHWQTEHAFYASKQGTRPHWYGDRSQSTVWRLTGQPASSGVLVSKDGLLLTDGEGRHLLLKEAPPPKSSKVRHIRVPAGETVMLLPQDGTTAWCVSRDPVTDYIHPNQKPAALAAKAILLSSQPGDVVVDMFAGSGSTLIACEQHGRKARIVEICPKNSAAILERWHNLTKKVPLLAA
jgi:DNA modification methylase